MWQVDRNGILFRDHFMSGALSETWNDKRNVIHTPFTSLGRKRQGWTKDCATTNILYYVVKVQRSHITLTWDENETYACLAFTFDQAQGLVTQNIIFQERVRWRSTSNVIQSKKLQTSIIFLVKLTLDRQLTSRINSEPRVTHTYLWGVQQFASHIPYVDSY
jgi:hypothetical protein